MKRRWLQLAVLAPLLGLAVMIGRAEMGIRSGPVFEVRIQGYDPRDLLRGRYLRYQYAFNWQGPHTCGAEASGIPQLDPLCCLCLTRPNGNGVHPPVRQVGCEEAEPHACDGVLRGRAVEPPLRYFIPEELAPELDEAMRHRDFSLEMTCGLDQAPAIRELRIDGEPWRQTLTR